LNGLKLKLVIEKNDYWIQQIEQRLISPINALIYILMYTVGIRGFLVLVCEVITYIGYLIEKGRDFIYRRFLHRDRHSSSQSHNEARVALKTLDDDVSDFEFN